MNVCDLTFSQLAMLLSYEKHANVMWRTVSQIVPRICYFIETLDVAYGVCGKGYV